MSTAKRASLRTLGATNDDDEAPSISGEYTMDSWRLSQGPPDMPTPVLFLDSVPRAPRAISLVNSLNHLPSAPPSIPVGCIEGPPLARQALNPPPSPVRSRSFVVIDASVEKSIAAFAGFGETPERLVDCPRYALQVFRRRRTLRRELSAARDRSSRDIAIYEWAIASADPDAMRSGVLLIACALAAIAFFAIVVVGIAIH